MSLLLTSARCLKLLLQIYCCAVLLVLLTPPVGLLHAQERADASERISKCQFYVASNPASSHHSLSDNIFQNVVKTIRQYHIQAIVLSGSETKSSRVFSTSEAAALLRNEFPDVRIYFPKSFDAGQPPPGVYINLCGGHPDQSPIDTGSLLVDGRVRFLIGSKLLRIPLSYLGEAFLADPPIATKTGEDIELYFTKDTSGTIQNLPCLPNQNTKCSQIKIEPPVNGNRKALIRSYGVNELYLTKGERARNGWQINFYDRDPAYSTKSMVIYKKSSGINAVGVCRFDRGTNQDKWKSVINGADETKIECYVRSQINSLPYAFTISTCLSNLDTGIRNSALVLHKVVSIDGDDASTKQ